MSNFEREGKRVSRTAQGSLGVPETGFNVAAGKDSKKLPRPSERVKLDQMKVTNYFSKRLSPPPYSVLVKISSSET